MRQCCSQTPKPVKPFVVETDASSVAVGAVVKQTDGEDEVSTLFYSLALNSAQRNYATYERERATGRHESLRRFPSLCAGSALYVASQSQSTRGNFQ